jgi:predicted nucleic acid-binding Zn ribbon protein
LTTYEYECECGEVTTRDYPMGKAKSKVKCPECGKMAPRKIAMPAVQCRYSYFERSAGNPRVNRGKGRR